jgi:hypothetical protein
VGALIVRAVVGALLGAGAVVLVGMVATLLYDIPQSEGSFAMGGAFVWVPVGAIAGALFGLLLAKKSR